jgi:hypothetical protein
MKNECLAAALRELNAAGIRDIQRSYGGQHLHKSSRAEAAQIWLGTARTAGMSVWA